MSCSRLESEALFSRFSGSRTNASGSYVQGQLSLFDAPTTGDLDPFARYDVVRLSRDLVGTAWQHAVRAGFNYNLPYTQKTVNLHVEYARNRVRGPSEIVVVARTFNEFRAEIRFNVTRYVRH